MTRLGVKWAFLLFVTAFLFTAFPAFAEEQPPKVIVNGMELQSGAQPQFIDGRLMFPMQFLSEALGAEITWDYATNVIEIKTATSTKTLTEEEWREQLTRTIKRQLPAILQSEDLSHSGKAVRIGVLISNNLTYVPPEHLRHVHYCFIQYLFARQYMLIATDELKDAIGDNTRFLATAGAFEFVEAIAKASYEKFKDYIIE